MVSYMYAIFLGTYVAGTATGQVTPKKTPLKIATAKTYLKSALTKKLGRTPTTKEVNMIAAHSSLETRRWQAMWHWNFGNSVAGTTTKSWYTLKGEKPHKYKVFNSAKEGAEYFVNLIQKRYPRAWNELNSGDVRAYAQALKDGEYFEAPLDKYTQALQGQYEAVA